MNKKFRIAEPLIIICGWVALCIAFRPFIVMQLVHLVTGLLSMLLSVNFQFTEGQGYLNKDLGIAINDSCSGFNFLLISACVLTSVVSFTHYLRTNVLLKMVFIAAMSVVFTVIANTGRIWLGILIIRFYPNNALLHKPMFHQTTGVFFFLGFLFLTVLALQYLINNHLTHEKDNQPALAHTGN